MFFNARKKTIAALQATNYQNTALLTAIDSAMLTMTFDWQGVVLHANSNFLKALGYRLDQVVGQPHRLLCPPDPARAADYNELWQRLRSGQFGSGTFEQVCADGTSIWLEASYQPVCDQSGKLIKVAMYALDVTVKVQAESEARAKWQAIDRAMAIIEFDPDGTILTANPNFLQRVGYSLASIQGKHHRVFCKPELVNSSAYSDFWLRLNKGECFSGQFERVDSQGRTLWLEANYNPVYDAKGKLCKVIKFASDITAMVEKHAADAQSASQAYHISLQTRDAAEKGSQVIQETASGMREIAADIDQSSALITRLGERSEQITTIVNTIRGIADQTNLLALNAAIEAARAGDQGRGFAVVADEVRQLAARTSGSTREISSMIEMIQSETRQAIDSMEGTRNRAAHGVGLANQAGTVILQIREGANDAVQAVSIFTREQGTASV
ncbi:methyl-accepting chemotaxis protein [Pseudomonas sp. SDO5271_S396]